MEKDKFILCCVVIAYLFIKKYYIIGLITLFLIIKYTINIILKDNKNRSPAYGSASGFY